MALVGFLLTAALLFTVLWGIEHIGGMPVTYIEQRLAHDTDTAKRADNQHNARMSGDPYGTYGDYPPEEM